ncbi:MAG: hypothetical protein K2Y51_14730 [Gammaproteobacteria bacterium]|nr:hypothetical protein [Gammaproteobacteria bacterium]
MTLPASDTPPVFPTRQALLALLVAWLTMLWLVAARPEAGPPTSDARFYTRLALGVSDFGVYGEFRGAGRAPTPAMEILPVYPLFLAGLARADTALGDSLRCALTPRADVAACPRHYQTLVRAQTALLALAAWLVWLCAWTWTNRARVAWLALGVTLPAGVLPEFAPVALTENLTLPLGGLFCLGLALALKRARPWRGALVMGLALGLLALTRPSFWYLLLAMAACAALLAPWSRWRRAARVLAMSAGLGALLVTPWLARNLLVFDTLAMSGGPYGGRTLMQRAAYNDMRWDEFGAAFLFWLPDFGDSLARMLLPARSYERLGWEQDSFYQASVRRVRAALRARPAAVELDRVLREEVLARPVAHARATVALAWRGLFIGKNWGLVAWLCALFVTLREARRRDWTLPLFFAPALFLCLFQAAVSVSIPRYNLLLLTPLALALALQVDGSIARWRARR